MANPSNKTSAKKSILDLSMAFKKDTKGTYVIENADAAMVLYVPKPFFAAAGIKPEGKTFRLTLVEE